jgi:hypothetical protein
MNKPTQSSSPCPGRFRVSDQVRVLYGIRGALVGEGIAGHSNRGKANLST